MTTNEAYEKYITPVNNRRRRNKAYKLLRTEYEYMKLWCSEDMYAQEYRTFLKNNLDNTMNQRGFPNGFVSDFQFI